MNGTPAPPSDAIVLWSEVILIWAIANYAIRDPMNDADDKREVRFWKRRQGWYGLIFARAAVAAIVVSLICRDGALPLVALIVAGAVALPLLRACIVSKWCAELEVAATLLVLFGSWEIIASHGLRATWGVIAPPLGSDHVVVMTFVAAAAVFVVNGGTYIVRGMLDKSGALPKLAPPEGAAQQQIDVAEFNRGRLIGTLERLLLLAVVIAGSYEALAFLVAAKGLIRSKDLEDRNWAEYFLVGSLASVLVALAAGLGAQYAVKTFW